MATAREAHAPSERESAVIPATTGRTGTLSVLYVSARFPPFVGGTEIHTAEVARRMAARGHRVTVLTTALSRDQVGETTTSEGVTVVRVRARPARRDLYFAPGICRYVKRGEWEIIHCQGYHTFVGPFAMLAAIVRKRPFVLTFHSGGHSSRLRRAVRPVQQLAMRPLLRRAERLIGVSTYEVEFFRRRLRLPRSQFVEITNGVSSEFYDDGSATAERPILCSVGRLERYKGHQRVIEALPRIRRTIPDVHLYIVGTGPYRRQLENAAARAGVADAVEFISIDPSARRELADLFRSARLVTLLSEYESQGVVGLEALAVGRPLLVVDGTALAELGRFGEVSVLPPLTDVSSLASIITEKLMYEGRSRPSDVPMWDSTVAQLESLYREIVGHRPAHRTR